MVGSAVLAQAGMPNLPHAARGSSDLNGSTSQTAHGLLQPTRPIFALESIRSWEASRSACDILAAL